MKLSSRLEAVARHVLPGLPAADIGADHALLSVYLVRQGISPRVIIGELNRGPYERARRYVREQGLEMCIEVRQGDGLEVLAPHEVASVVIAGMGGKNIAGILLKSLARAYTYQRYVLQPMRPYYPLRKLLADLGWAIVDEEVAAGDAEFYPIVVVEPRRCPAYHLGELELELGPRILERATQPGVKEFLQQELVRYERAIAGLRQAGSAEARDKLAAYHKLKMRLEEMMDPGWS